MSEELTLNDELKMLQEDIDQTAPKIEDFPLDKQQTIFKPVPQGPKKETRGRKPIKSDLIDKIHKLQHALGLPQDDTAKLKFLSVAKLNEKLAKLTTKGTNVYFDVVDEQPQPGNREESEYESSDDGGEPSSGGPRVFSDKLAVNQLFTFNMVVARFLELTTKNFKDQIGADCDGLCRDLMEPENKEQLEEILKLIYQENSSHIKKYLTPLNQYMLFMIGMTANRMAINAKKDS